MAVRLPIPTDSGVRAVLDRQVQVMFVLASEVLADVTLDECLRQSDPNSWTVTERDGHWFGELHEEPPDPPTPSLGWTMWHPIWWLSTLLAHTRNEDGPDAMSVEWPGPSATLPTMLELWSEWTDWVDALDDNDLRSGRLTRFPYDDGRPFVYVLGWASMELTKNLAEICLLRRLARESMQH
jgi:hypothetical protein